MKNALIIFVRKPEPGKVKTRLAATVGNEKALAIYNELLLHTFIVTNKLEADKFVFYTNKIEETDLWSAAGFFKKIQTDEDLGGKMKLAFFEIFSAGYKKVVIIGSDCFEISTIILNKAFTLLDENDFVIGPANDGGYYLLGMKKLHDFIFENKAWSTENVYSHTLTDIKKNKLSVASLPVLIDVDTEEDWLASKKIKL